MQPIHFSPDRARRHRVLPSADGSSSGVLFEPLESRILMDAGPIFPNERPQEIFTPSAGFPLMTKSLQAGPSIADDMRWLTAIESLSHTMDLRVLDSGEIAHVGVEYDWGPGAAKFPPDARLILTTLGPGGDVRSSVRIDLPKDEVFAHYELDEQGNCYVVGTYKPFLAKYDAEGKTVWKKQLHVQWVSWVALGPHDEIYIAGAHQVFEGGQHVDTDAFIARFDADGNQLWTNTFKSPRWDMVDVLVADAQGGVYASVSSYPLVGQDEYETIPELWKLDSAGKRIWTRDASGTTAMIPNDEGCVYGVVELYPEGLTFPSGFMLTKYDPRGRILWTRQWEPAGWLQFGGFVADGETLRIAGAAKQDGSTNVDTLLMTIDGRGNLVGTDRIDAAWDEYPLRLMLDADRNLYMIGLVEGEYEEVLIHPFIASYAPSQSSSRATASVDALLAAYMQHTSESGVMFSGAGWTPPTTSRGSGWRLGASPGPLHLALTNQL